MVSLSVVVCFAVLAAAAATNVRQCPGKNIANLSDNVKVEPCKKLPCKLKKGTSQTIIITFTPEEDMNEVKTAVTAEVATIPLPFIGVDDTSICGKVFTEDGQQSSCPLKAGTTYLYKDSFPIHNIYPELNTVVRWALKYGDDEFMCFQVPAKIVK